MSTHNIGFYEDLTKIIFELSSNIIRYAPYFFCCIVYTCTTHVLNFYQFHISDYQFCPKHCNSKSVLKLQVFKILLHILCQTEYQVLSRNSLFSTEKQKLIWSLNETPKIHWDVFLLERSSHSKCKYFYLIKILCSDLVNRHQYDVHILK